MRRQFFPRKLRSLVRAATEKDWPWEELEGSPAEWYRGRGTCCTSQLVVDEAVDGGGVKHEGIEVATVACSADLSRLFFFDGRQLGNYGAAARRQAGRAH